MWFNRLIRQRDGQAMVYVAIAITVLMGFTGLVIDGGRLYISKSHLQKAVDAGALAGANVMLEGQEANAGFNHDAAEIEAKELTAVNYISPDISYNTGFPEENIIEVTGQEMVSLFLMPLLGIDEISEVNAVAQAKVGKLVKIDKGNIIPIGINLNQTFEVGVTHEITSNPGDGAYGNFGFLNFSSLDSTPAEDSSNGAKAVAYYIENGSPVPITEGDVIGTKTGVPFSADVVDAIEAKVGQKVYVPIISDFGSGTSDPVTVLGFAVFILEGFYKDGNVHTIQATFVEEIKTGEMGEGSAEYGLYSVKLIK
ncbi:TadE/TadG family type IV pilus assembly protein [Neobacillus sp. LXY-4]|uniref:TadE/TadG family type IV pilus assembly protein n=1 Tax=Neobacillus sp. LXY-4 TaxID=3379826 RepID=UPI003EE2C7A5